MLFGEIAMTNAPTAKRESTNEARQIVLKDVHAKWSKFYEQEISALKGKDDLVTQVVAKYGLEKGQAQRDVDAVLKGRSI